MKAVSLLLPLVVVMTTMCIGAFAEGRDLCGVEPDTKAPTQPQPVTPAPSVVPTPAQTTRKPTPPSTEAPIPSPTILAPTPKPDDNSNAYGRDKEEDNANGGANITTVDGGLNTDEVQEMLNRVNALREQYGKSPVVTDPKLMDAAQKHSEEQANRCKMSHTFGVSPGDRAKRSGYSSGMIWENVAAGLSSVSSVMDSWTNSSGHFENLVESPTTQVGFGKATNSECGNYNVYWTQCFGQP